MLQLFMFLHIGAAIVAFGPTFALSIVGAMSGKEPQHGNFALRVAERISTLLVYPFALSLPVTGLGLIYLGEVDWTRPWLLVAIVLYVAALAYSLVVQRSVLLRMIELTSRGPGGGPAPGAPAGPPPGGPPPGGAPGGAPGGPPPGGPPPEFLALVKRSQQGGMLLTGLFVAILALMIWKPGG